MFFSSAIRGDDLPAKTVCLTFDDGPGETDGPGPGPRTLDVAEFLHNQQIEATFFMIGEVASTRKEIVHRVARLGHLIGNHTFNHTRLAGESGAFAADQILKADHIFSDIPQSVRCFRPPHGSWSRSVAGELNCTPASTYIGPVLWDVDGADWRFWSAGRMAEECASIYIERIQAAGSGLIIMHDSSFETEIRLQNRTLEAIKLIVYWLRENGHSFVRLDCIPQVREAMRISSVVAFQTVTGRYLSAEGGGGAEITANASTVGGQEAFGVVALGGSQIAIRCLSGHYLSVQDGGGAAVLASATKIDKWEVLTVIDLGEDKIALRCPNGQYVSLVASDDGRIAANASSVGESTALRQVQCCPAAS